MSFRRRLKGKRPPAGWDLIEESIEDFEQQMKDAVAEEHEGKRKNELTWRIHRVHWEKNRFIFDLRYKRKAMSEELYNYLCREKVADQALISKWRKPGYENLCSLLAIQKGDTNFGTASICRVPMASRAPQQQHLCTPPVRHPHNHTRLLFAAQANTSAPRRSNRRSASRRRAARQGGHVATRF